MVATACPSAPSQAPLELLARCRRGDASAWRRLLAEVRQQALESARWRYGLGADDAEDVAQVVQIRVCERVEQLRDGNAFTAWVRRVVHHAVVDLLRSRKAPAVSLDELTHPEGLLSEPEAPDEYERIVLRADLAQALARLPERYREPIRLHLLNGLQQDEIGRLLGRPRSTVATQIERGLNRLQRSMGSLAA
jgi:RNA polymerase sigma-70 factor, ECF subfamily